MQSAFLQAPAPAGRRENLDVSGAPALRLNRLWAGSDYGFGDGAACDDYYVEPSARVAHAGSDKRE